MQYSETTKAYNERRYGRPWMARVTISTTKDFDFIDWEGRNGCEGQFNFEADPGTLLAYGQKDIRKGRGGIGGYQICMPDGTLSGIYPCSAINLRKLGMADRIIAVATAMIALLSDRVRYPEAKAAIARYSAYLPAEEKEGN